MLHSLSNSFVLVSFATGGTLGAPSHENVTQPQRMNQALQGIHGPRSIDQELDHLTKDLELTANQRDQIRPLLEERDNRIQALLDKNPTASREALEPQIHVISDQTQTKLITKLKRC